jgi:hypothetical protein
VQSGVYVIPQHKFILLLTRMPPKAEARQAPRNIGLIPNWSPTVDITSTNVASGSHADTRSPKARNRSALDGSLVSKPDQLFVCSGRGQTGSIAELRYGLEAKVGSSMDCEDPIKQCWAMKCPTTESSGELCLLVAFPNRSDVFSINLDTSDVVSRTPDEVPYDLSSTTIAALELEDDSIIQVTACSISVITSTNR